MASRAAEHDVIILGAGAAGLAAARELTNAGIRSLVIEARDRIGGRIFTLKQNGGGPPIELGAEFIHGKSKEIFDIVDEADLETRAVEWAPWHLSPDGKLAPGQSYDPTGEDKIWKRLDRFFDETERDVSLKEFLEHADAESASFESREIVKSYVGGFHAAEIEKIGVRSLVKTERAADKIQGDRSFRLPAGYRSITDHLWDDAKKGTELRLGMVVKRISWSKGAIEITVTNAENAESVFTCKTAIITLPVGVLKEPPESPYAVIFEPPLDIKREALEKIEMGAALRLVFHFKTKWWNEILEKIKPGTKPLGFLFAPRETIRVWWADEPSDTAMLTGWAGGGIALKLYEFNTEELGKRAIDSLCRIFGVTRHKIEQEMLSMNFHDWQNDPFALGSYSYMAAGGANAPETLSERIDNTLFFAGEAASYDGHWGTVHGAIASGIRAAKEIIAARNAANVN